MSKKSPLKMNMNLVRGARKGYEAENVGAGANAKMFSNIGGYIAKGCLLYTSPSPRDLSTSRMPSSA